VLRHEDIAEEIELMFLTNPFEGFEEDCSGGVVGEKWETVVTTKSKEVVVTFGLVTLQTARHKREYGS